MLVNKEALKLKKILLKKENLFCQCLKIEKHENFYRAIATDRCVLCIFEEPLRSEADFPPDENNNNETEIIEALLTYQTIEKIEKLLPKKPAMPILNYFQLKDSEKNHIVKISDIENFVKITQLKVKENYPDYESIFLKEYQSIEKISFTPAILSKLLTVANAYKVREIKYKFAGETKPVYFEFKDFALQTEGIKIYGLIMPKID